MLSPKRTKFRKYQKGRTKGIKPNQTDLQFGKYGLKSLESNLSKNNRGCKTGYDA